MLLLANINKEQTTKRTSIMDGTQNHCARQNILCTKKYILYTSSIMSSLKTSKTKLGERTHGGGYLWRWTGKGHKDLGIIEIFYILLVVMFT